MGLDKKQGHLVVITGLPAAGKDTVVEKLLEYREFNLQRIVTYNTRPPRPGEIHGVHHYFVSEEEFHLLRKKGLLLEYVKTGWSWKGTPREPFEKIVRDEGNFVWRIDPSRSANLDEFFVEKFGRIQGQKLFEKMSIIFLSVKSTELLKERFQLRDPNQDLKDFYQRLEEDMKILERFRHKFPHLVFNDKPIEETVEEVIQIIKFSSLRAI